MITLLQSPTRYDNLSGDGYVALGVALALPCVVGPAFATYDADPNPIRGGTATEVTEVAWSSRHYVKLNIFCGVQVYVGSYFFTHYFYALLGVRYAILLDAAAVPFGRAAFAWCLLVPVGAFWCQAVSCQAFGSRASVFGRPPSPAPHAPRPTPLPVAPVLGNGIVRRPPVPDVFVSAATPLV